MSKSKILHLILYIGGFTHGLLVFNAFQAWQKSEANKPPEQFDPASVTATGNTFTVSTSQVFVWTSGGWKLLGPDPQRRQESGPTEVHTRRILGLDGRPLLTIKRQREEGGQWSTSAEIHPRGRGWSETVDGERAESLADIATMLEMNATADEQPKP